MPYSRQLAAIMFTDIEGYTALMQHNEGRAMQVRAKHRRIFNTNTALYRGRILQYYGDGTLSIFDSAIDAVKSAIEMQRSFQEEPSIPVRIGLHIGDISVTDEEIIGDGVNIASRLEAIAVPGSVIISGKVFDEIRNQDDIQTTRLQAFMLKNVDKPVEVYAVSNAGLVVPTPDDISGRGATDKFRPFRKKKWRIQAIIPWALALVVAVVLLVALFNQNNNADVPTWGEEHSIAVLPFVNMSGDPGQEYFSDGMTDEIINGLAQIEGLKVSGRTSSFFYKDKEVKLSEIGRELNVNTILEGSVQKAGDDVRIIVQLINAEDAYHLWSERYDRKFEDVFALQADISAKVAEKMKVTMAGGKSNGTLPTSDLEAYEMFLKGRYFREQGIEGLERARSYFEHAIDLDPSYAAAYGELAGTYFLMSVFKILPPEEGFRKVPELGRKAIELDPTLPGRHMGLAIYYFWVAWDWEAAISEYEKEMALGSPPSIFHPMYQTFLYGNFDAAIEEARAIGARDPLNTELMRDLTVIYTMARQYSEARATARAITDLTPNHSEAYRLIGGTYLYEAQYDSAMYYFKRADEMSAGQGYASTDIIITHAVMGQLAEARRLFNEIKEGDALGNLFNFEIANIYYALDDHDAMYKYLNRSFDKKEFWLISIKVDPGLDPLRDDPRFQRLVDKMDFPET
jgi:adenylate cyclase